MARFLTVRRTEGIILGWAVPRQGGLSHINNKPIEYVLKVMRENGFQRDAGKSMKLQASSSLSWIKSNIQLQVILSNHIVEYHTVEC
jgi:hypothetical protein